MRFPLGEMTVGDVLDRGIKVLFARLPVFYAINLLVLSPLIAVQVIWPLVLGNDNPLDPAAMFATAGFGLVAVFLALVFQPIATAAILYIVMEEYAGRRPGMGAALGFALSRFPTLLGASIIVGLIVGVGFILCCAPGIYFYVTYAFVGQVVVLERLGVGESLQRAQNLVTGHRWRVLGVLLLIGIANWIVQMSIGMGLGFVLPAQEFVPVEGGVRTKLNPLNHVIDTLIAQLAAILFSTYIAVCTTLLYLDLRIRKEGFDLELATGGEPREDDERDDRDDRDEERDQDRDDDRDRERDRDDRDRDRDRDDRDRRA
jgi:hypothetical protein